MDTCRHFLDVCADALVAAGSGDFDRLCGALAMLQGCHRLLPRRLLARNRRDLACRYARRAAESRNTQYPRQICFSPTFACQLNCSYCVSAGLEVNARNTAPVGDAIALLDWAKAKNVVRVCLSGGEPTLYPHFSELLRHAHELGLGMILATNGLGSPETTEAVIENRMESVTLHLTEELAESGDLGAFEKTARRLIDAGLYVAMRYNLTTTGDTAAKCVEVADRLRIPEIRVAVPIPNTKRMNKFVSPDDLRPFGDLVARCVSLAADRGIHVSLAKPFPPCMLPEHVAAGFLADGSMLSNCQVRMQGFSHNIVVHPDMKFSPCLALNRKSECSILDCRGVRSAAAVYRKKVGELMRQPFMEACGSCPLSIGGRCLGGCLSYRL